MTNFDFLLATPAFESFAPVAVAAERIYAIDPSAAVVNCRRAMEYAVKWMYSVDEALVMPWDDRLSSLMSADEFRGIVDDNTLRRMDYIRRLGNIAAHEGNKITDDQARLCLRHLYSFMDFVACCYADSYQPGQYDPALLDAPAAPVPAPDPEKDLRIEELMKENAALRDRLTARREAQRDSYVPKPMEASEFTTRKAYIDTMLQDAGWREGADWLNEVALHGMPNASGVGYADYVLYGADGRALAVVEAKRTCADVARGRQQARLYADIIEQQQGRRPVVFLTNGFETRIIDNQYPERRCATVWSKRDLEKWFNLQAMRTSLANIVVDKHIAGRYYQEQAVRAVCESFDAGNRRRALLVMATGSGKTRTVIALVKVLLEQGWVKNVLFLADRNALVRQAKGSFVNLLPDLSVVNLCEDRDNYAAHGVFSTYQTMYHCIDSVRDDEGRLFTCGHFDLIVCDEAHRSIYNKYKDIFDYFDAPLVGLTATPKDEIDKNTYGIFDLQSGVPTYGYELAQAVRDGFLVDFVSVETKLKFLEEGIAYDELSDEDKQAYEDTFTDENGELPERIASSALNAWLFNEDTIRQVLDTLMTHGLKVDYGNRIGKTIIFARNHRHAEAVKRVFDREYPHLNGYVEVIDNQINYAQDLIDRFSEPNKPPYIAISVDMLDTGIDVPEVLNLVFFKKVMSKAKFWQMIGRGTRLCPGLLDGADKEKFYIFDFCGNFEFFRMNPGMPVPNTIALSGAIFAVKADIAFKLQDAAFQTPELTAFRDCLVRDMAGKVGELKRDNFAVRQHLRCVERFTDPESYRALTYEDTLLMKQELAPLIQPDADDAKALRFDALVYGIELACLVGKKYARGRSDLVKKATAIYAMTSSSGKIPEIERQKPFLEKLLHTDYLDNAGINEFEQIRERLRDLIKYIPYRGPIFNTDFGDELLSMEWNESDLESDDLKDYRAKAEFYIRQHRDNAAIAKLRGNVPLTPGDVAELEKILWSEVGTRQDYEASFGQKPLGELVREVVGLDMAAAKAAFSDFLDGANLDSRQIYFVNQIVEYIVRNGMMKDLSVLQQPPFTDRGNVVELFSTNLGVWNDIRRAIEQVNANASAA